MPKYIKEAAREFIVMRTVTTALLGSLLCCGCSMGHGKYACELLEQEAESMRVVAAARGEGWLKGKDWQPLARVAGRTDQKDGGLEIRREAGPDRICVRSPNVPSDIACVNVADGKETVSCKP